jgi:hypothetical protein
VVRPAETVLSFFGFSEVLLFILFRYPFIESGIRADRRKGGSLVPVPVGDLDERAARPAALSPGLLQQVSSGIMHTENKLGVCTTLLFSESGIASREFPGLMPS